MNYIRGNNRDYKAAAAGKGGSNAKVGRLQPFTRAWYGYYIRKYEEAIKYCKEQQRKAKH